MKTKEVSNHSFVQAKRTPFSKFALFLNELRKKAFKERRQYKFMLGEKEISNWEAFHFDNNLSRILRGESKVRIVWR
jgi:hypothetical protein